MNITINYDPDLHNLTIEQAKILGNIIVTHSPYIGDAYTKLTMLRAEHTANSEFATISLLNVPENPYKFLKDEDEIVREFARVLVKNSND